MPAYVLTHGQDLLARCLVGVWLAASGGFGKRGCGVTAVQRVRPNRLQVAWSGLHDHATFFTASGYDLRFRFRRQLVEK
jgi:hypothetical protein